MTTAGLGGQAPCRHLCCRGPTDVRTFRCGHNRSAKNVPHGTLLPAARETLDRGEATARAPGGRAAPGQCWERGEASPGLGRLRLGSDLGRLGALGLPQGARGGHWEGTQELPVLQECPRVTEPPCAVAGAKCPVSRLSTQGRPLLLNLGPPAGVCVGEGPFMQLPPPPPPAVAGSPSAPVP